MAIVPVLPVTGGCSSVVEHQLPKLRAVGSIPITRSIIFFRMSLKNVAAWCRNKTFGEYRLRKKRTGEVAISTRSGNNRSFATRLVSLCGTAALAFALTAGMPAQTGAQDMNGVVASDVDLATRPWMAYIRTGNAGLDGLTEAGMFGLGKQLYHRSMVQRTVVHADGDGAESSTAQIMPYGIELDEALTYDDLSYHRIIFWAIDPGQEQPSAETIRVLNEFLEKGGTLFFDVREDATNGRGRSWLRTLAENGLNIPAPPILQKAEGCDEYTEGADCSLLGKAFYLLDKFPGGQLEEDGLWVAESVNGSGQPSVIIGANDWSRAWAVNDEGQYVLPVSGEMAEQREYAYRTGINIWITALTGGYKDDDTFTPHIEKRLRPDS